MALAEYRRKRDFKRTAEPEGKRAAEKGTHRYVIQKHAATRLHYDFRLEMGGTLKSWALPKGVPYTKGDKRLAVQVEDHPIDYAGFEGTIPKGQYGGGTVMVWDFGTFEPASPTPEKDLASGKLHFALHGKKLKGEWHLVQMRGGTGWLLIKGGEDMRPVSDRQDDTSALSGKSMKQIAGSDEVWESNRPAKRRVSTPKPKPPQTAPRQFQFIPPMKARLVDQAPHTGEWIYEIKFDGFRALAFKSGDHVQLLSRNQNDLTAKFPQIADSVRELKAEAVVLDGEIVALDEQGRSSFQLLQAYDMGEERPPVFYYAFDLLHFGEADLTDQPVIQRKSRLEQLLKGSKGLVRYSGSLGDDAKALMVKARQLGLEGLIGKRKDSVYEAGRRSGAWIKLKLHQEQEMIIGGYTRPEGARQHFGALLVGYYEKGKLKFAGKVGTGFSDKILRSLFSRFKELASNSCPFSNVPERTTGRYGQNLTPAEMRRCSWVKPVLVCQVKYSEWTRDGKLRQPVFLGLREDKSAAEVVKERPQ